MLKRIQFKNWRSLRDVEIDDLQPITVFIGANSSGKSNIVEALAFMRRALPDEHNPANQFFIDREGVKTVGVSSDTPVEIEYFRDGGILCTVLKKLV